MLPDLVYKFQIICLRRSKVIERKPDIFVFFGKTRDITAEQEKISNLGCLLKFLTMCINLK